MLYNYNNENKLNEYIDYLKDKGKIIKIKDINKNISIKFSTGIIYYFLLVVSILLVLSIISFTFNSFSDINNGYDIQSNMVIIVGLSLFTSIIIGVALKEKALMKLDISYPNDYQIKINNKVYTINEQDCYIDIVKMYQYNPRYESNREYTVRRESHTTKYFLIIKNNNIKKSFQIKNGTEENLSDFIYNFEYEFSDFKMKKAELLKQVQDTLEEKYKK